MIPNKLKEKISRFEYAIMKIACPDEIENFEPYTESEEMEVRRNELLNQAKKLKLL